MYQTVTNELGKEFITFTNPDGSTLWIPIDEANSDYQAYLKSLDEAASL